MIQRLSMDGKSDGVMCCWMSWPPWASYERKEMNDRQWQTSLGGLTRCRVYREGNRPEKTIGGDPVL